MSFLCVYVVQMNIDTSCWLVLNVLSSIFQADSDISRGSPMPTVVNFQPHDLIWLLHFNLYMIKWNEWEEYLTRYMET